MLKTKPSILSGQAYMIDLSVVVPILDDDLQLKELLPELSGAFSEVVIIDGGESELAQQLAEHHGAVYSVSYTHLTLPTNREV